MKVTKKLLEQMGIFHKESKLKPFLYWCNITQCHLTITDKMSMEDVAALIYESGVDYGFIDGKRQRSNEFKSLLNNSDL